MNSKIKLLHADTLSAVEEATNDFINNLDGKVLHVKYGNYRDSDDNVVHVCSVAYVLNLKKYNKPRYS